MHLLELFQKPKPTPVIEQSLDEQVLQALTQLQLAQEHLKYCQGIYDNLQNQEMAQMPLRRRLLRDLEKKEDELAQLLRGRRMFDEGYGLAMAQRADILQQLAYLPEEN